MKEKFILVKPYVCSLGTLPVNTEIIWFNGQFWVNGGPAPLSYNDILSELINNKEYTVKQQIIPNKI